MDKLYPCPFIHPGPRKFYNPLTDKTLTANHPAYGYLKQILFKRQLQGIPFSVKQYLLCNGWLVEKQRFDSFYLKYVSIETHTVCNQACFFCPVSIHPREKYFMPLNFFEKIASQLSRYSHTIETVFLNNYNEPTIDPNFTKQIEILNNLSLKVTLLTNASALTPEKSEQIIDVGGLLHLSVNLSTIDRDEYKKERGKDHLKQVLNNLAYIKNRRIANTMRIIVLGLGDRKHLETLEKIDNFFRNSLFEVRPFLIDDRAGVIKNSARKQKKNGLLRGCDHIGSRPVQHLHIDPYGRCILCCQDYFGKEIVGNLHEQSIEEVLQGAKISELRKIIYGFKEPPKNFICTGCSFAITS